jgi:L-lactate dehydrogenase (cytochrome)
MGEAGVTRCLELIANELDVTMAFCGRTNIRDVDRSILLNADLFDRPGRS